MFKKLGTLSIMVVVFVLVFGAAYVNAKEVKASVGEIKKIVEKMSKNASYTTETKTTIGGKDYITKQKYYFKDLKTYRIDAETQGLKNATVATPAKSFMVDFNTMKEEPLPKETVAAMQPVKALEAQCKGAAITVEKTADQKIYRIVNKKAGSKVEYHADAKQNVFTKMIVYKPTGEVMSETVYSEFKAEKLDDALFTKVEAAQAAPAPVTPVAPQAPATGEVKVEAPAAPVAPAAEVPAAPAAPASEEVKTN